MDQSARRTQLAYICIRLMSTPCWCLLSLLVFILYKIMHLTPLQITLIVALKPSASLLSPYWSQAIYQRADKIITNLIGANFFRHLPFLFIPWVQSPWYIIFSFGLYMMLTRATIPAWMELFKYNLPKSKPEQMVGYGTTIEYLGTAVVTVGMGVLLDSDQDIWKWLFPISAGLGILSTFLLTSIPLQHPSTISIVAPPSVQSFNIKEKIFNPWQQVWRLISQRKDFIIFQIGFMLGGAGLMIMQPALPQFFIDILHLSFTEMGIAIAFCKGVGVALTSPLWIRLFRKSNIFQFSALVTFFASLFPFFLLATSYNLISVYFAYVFWGIMQAGSELSWHMSGLVFAREKDSSTFSITNVLTVGIRGCFVPALGAMLLPFFQPLGVILSGAFLCLLASVYFLFNSRVYFALPEKSQL
jgi:Major Facilitator Superfamily